VHHLSQQTAIATRMAIDNFQVRGVGDDVRWVCALLSVVLHRGVRD